MDLDFLGEDWLWPVAGGVAGLALALALSDSEKSTKSSWKPRSVQGINNVLRYLEAAGKSAHIGNGFVPYSLAVVRRESRFNNLAAKTSASERAASCSLWRGNSRYVNSPYGQADFCIGSGGWFGFLPATALAPQPFHNLSPQLIFDPAFATAAWTAYVEAIVRKYFPKLPVEHRNWLSVNRSMASLGTMYDYNETHSAARRSRENLAKNLIAIGASPDLMYTRPSIGTYPGAAKVWEDLRRL
jgi:hypothetical protein